MGIDTLLVCIAAFMGSFAGLMLAQALFIGIFGQYFRTFEGQEKKHFSLSPRVSTGSKKIRPKHNDDKMLFEKERDERQRRGVQMW